MTPARTRRCKRCGRWRPPRERADYVTHNSTTHVTSVAVHYTLDSYGNVLDGDTSLVRYIYTGQEFDAETGDYYYDARYYDPATGRFKSEDPIGYAGDVSNDYRYVGNAATMFVDPSGLHYPGGPPVQSVIGGPPPMYYHNGIAYPVDATWLPGMGWYSTPVQSTDPGQSGPVNAMILPADPTGLPSDWVHDPTHLNPNGQCFASER